jgi:hypothetical protein
MVPILPALRQVREDLVRILDRDTVERLCKELGYHWRGRRLDPWTTLHLFILQVLNHNTAMTHLPHLSGERFSASAYCQARQRLPLELLKQLVNRFGRQLDGSGGTPLWNGHRILLEDGSGFSMPDTAELQACFGQPGNQKPGCGFPVAHLLALCDAQAGFLREAMVFPLRTQDIAHAADLHPRMTAGDILIGDRGFCSYAHLALISQANLHAVFRVHQKKIVDFRPHRPHANKAVSKGRPRSRWIKRLGHYDQLVEWRKPASRPKWMTAEQFAQLPDQILLREIKWRIRESNHRVGEVILVTTLLDPFEYPAREIAALYRRRWQVEVDLRDLKITLGLDVLKGHSVDVVIKELQVFVLVYNLVRLVLLKAARRQRVDPHRLSFIDALRWLQPPKPEQTFADLIINLDRPNRLEPRCIKRHMKEYDLMTRPRHELRKRLKKRLDAA